MSKLSISKNSKLKSKKSKMSTASALMHKKWQETATSMGGGQIVVQKMDAKRIIMNLLRDNFRPMNITMIHKELKGTVPSPLLKSCLDEMSAEPNKSKDDDQDDDDFVKTPVSTKKKVPNDEYTSTIKMKVGRNESSNLYFANQSKLINDGNGFEPQAKSDFLGEKEKSKSELALLKSSHGNMTKKAEQLLSEPTNKDIEQLMTKESKENEEVRSKLEEMRHLKDNERNRKSTAKRIEKMALAWRKRKRMCVDFLNMLEDCTEGTIRTKQCLAGNGQIEIESDETIAKEAKTAYVQIKDRKIAKRPRLSGSFRGQQNSQGKAASKGVEPTASFIAVMLEPGFDISVKRIFAESN